MAETRVEQWKRKLLDLSLRNPLLNVRDSSKFLPLEDGVSYAGGAALYCKRCRLNFCLR